VDVVFPPGAPSFAVSSSVTPVGLSA
jgi:hypothetical protein